MELRAKPRGHRDTLDKWAAAKGSEGSSAYRKLKNRTSIDRLPAFTAD
jgi:hypothetical protein